MGRKLWMTFALLVSIITPSAWPAAAPRVAGGDTTFAFGWAKGEPTLRAEGRGVKFFKRVGRDKVSIRVEVPGDVMELEAETNGAIRIGRKGRFLRLQMKDDFEANFAKVQKLTAGSKALDRFEGLVASLAANQTPQAQSLRTSHALLNAVRGVTIQPNPMPQAPARSGQVVLATYKGSTEGPFACWAEYASTVDQYNVQFNACVENYWWIPGWTAACGLQFALQSELAWFWLLSCSGGMPV